MPDMNKGNWKKILFFLIFIVVSDDTLFFGTAKNGTFITFKYIVIISLTLVMTIKYVLLQRQYNSLSFLYIIALDLLLLISSFFNDDLRNGVFYKIALIFLAFSITRKMSLHEFAYYFEKIIYFFACFSLIGMALGLFGKGILSLLPVFLNSADNAFYNALVFCVPVTNSVVRNYGIFREPGVYQMYIIWAMVFQVGILKNAKTSRMVVYILALLTTYSTTGYFALGLVIILFLLSREENNGRTYKTVLGITVCIFCVCAFVSPDLFDVLSDTVFGKLSNMSRHTTIARVGSITVNAKIFFDNILFGVGLTRLSELFPVYCRDLYGFASVHNTNTILIQFSTHGIFYGLLWTLGYIRLSWKLGSDTLSRMIYFGIFVILFVGENLSFSTITYILLIYGMQIVVNRDEESMVELKENVEVY